MTAPARPDRRWWGRRDWEIETLLGEAGAACFLDLADGGAEIVAIAELRADLACGRHRQILAEAAQGMRGGGR